MSNSLGTEKSRLTIRDSFVGAAFLLVVFIFPRILPGALLFAILMAAGTGLKRSGNIILGLVLLLLGWLFPGFALGALLICIIVVVAGNGLAPKRRLRAGS